MLQAHLSLLLSPFPSISSPSSCHPIQSKDEHLLISWGLHPKAGQASSLPHSLVNLCLSLDLTLPVGKANPGKRSKKQIQEEKGGKASSSPVPRASPAARLTLGFHGRGEPRGAAGAHLVPERGMRELESPHPAQGWWPAWLPRGLLPPNPHLTLFPHHLTSLTLMEGKSFPRAQ